MKYTLLIIAAIGTVYWWVNRPIEHEPGILIAEKPKQRLISKRTAFQHEGYRITPMATFDIKARVLGIEGYSFDRAADLSPVDLALGWGPMSDEAVLDKISISQAARFYFWRTRRVPIPRREIETNSANMHIIPANDIVDDQLDDIRVGSLIRLKGNLVAVKGTDGWQWNSSMKRTDTGNGACEIIWVEEVEFL